MSNIHDAFGLSEKEAERRLKEWGPNVLPTLKRHTYLNIVWDICKEPMFILLVLASVIYLIFGELHEGLALCVFVTFIIAINLYQHGKAENALQALRDLSSPRALVIRDGQTRRVSGQLVVPGDVVIICEGDRIPADGYLCSANDLQINESILTGESLPVLKCINKQDKEIGFVYSGTMVIQGQGIFSVSATGKNTELGKISVSLQEIETEISPLQNQTNQLVKIFSILGLSISVALIILLGLLNHNWLSAALSGIALAMSLLPEEIPVILTLFMIMGAWRLSRNNVLTRKVSAIETLGAITVLCTDKTGTITENKMKVTKLWQYDLNIDTTNKLIEYGVLASEIQPLDEMEKAIHELAGSNRKSNWLLIHEYDRTSQIPIKTHIWKAPDQEHYIVAAKGAPESIIALCRLTEAEKLNINAALQSMASSGLRLLAVGCGIFKSENWPSSQDAFELNFLGILGFSDPLRKGIRESVEECKNAGVRIIMITGDHPNTAVSIGREAGLSVDNVVIGSMLENSSDAALKESMQTASICARITPEQKLRIVEALKAKGNIVAMTGDGVNDAPALKCANVGIAMGMRGTDVAREASSLVLIDDDFSSIVHGVALGRRIFNNIQKSISYILAVHVPIAGMALFPVMVGLPAIFYPMHIAFLQLIIDPACSIAFENEPPEADIMARPPRDVTKPLMDNKTIIYSIMQGLGVFVIVFLAYYLSLNLMTESQARSFAFVSLVVSNLVLIYSNRSYTKSLFKSLLVPNRLLFYISMFAFIFLLSAIYIPVIASLFRFSALSLSKLFVAVSIGLLSTVWFELIKKKFKVFN